MTRAEDIAARLAQVRAQIAAAAARAGRTPDQVRLVAVSKRMPADDVRAAMDAGQLDFGENYAQELRDKRAALQAAALSPRWHYIGPLQRNKVKFLAGQVALIQSVADMDMLEEIDRRAEAAGVEQDCLLQVNIAGEAQKSGAPVAAVPALLDAFTRARRASCRGLMLIPPLADGAAVEQTRRHFAALRELRDREAAIARPRVELRELSMGMSGDFEEAIAQGATLVRVGTAIFGARVPG